jgi:polysaccharide export outer membrane protein
MNKTGVTLVVLTLILVPLAGSSAGQDSSKGVAPDHSAQVSTGIHPSTEQGVDRPALHRRNGRYSLHLSDVLDLTFPFTPEFNQTVTLQPDGYITLRGLGSLHVEGQTIPEVTHALQTAYGQILRDPVITVELKDFEKPFFIAGGEVGRPGKYDLRGDITLTQAVAIAGGFNESSKHSEVLLFHRVSNDLVEVKKLNVKQMLRAANISEDPHLQPGDMLFVPQNSFSKFKRFIPTSSLGMYLNRPLP